MSFQILTWSVITRTNTTTGESLENKHTSKQTHLERKVKLIFKFILIIPPDNVQVLCHRLCFFVDKGERVEVVWWKRK